MSSPVADSDHDDGFDSDELLLVVHKTRVDGSSEAIAVQRLINSLKSQLHNKQSAKDAALLFLSEVNLSVTEAQLAFVYYEGVSTILSLLPSFSSRSCTAAADILASCAVHPLVQQSALSNNGVAILTERLCSPDAFCSSDCETTVPCVSLIISLLSAMANFCRNTANNRRALRQHLRSSKKSPLHITLSLLKSIFSVLGTSQAKPPETKPPGTPRRIRHRSTDFNASVKKSQSSSFESLLDLESALKIGSATCQVLHMACKNGSNRSFLLNNKGFDLLCGLIELLVGLESSSVTNLSELKSSMLLPLVNSISLILNSIKETAVKKYLGRFDLLFSCLLSLLPSTFSNDIRFASCSVLKFLLKFEKYRKVISTQDGLVHLANLLTSVASTLPRDPTPTSISNVSNVLASVAHAAINPINAKVLVENKTAISLSTLLNNNSVPVQIEACCCLSVLARLSPQGPSSIKSANVIPSLIKSLLSTHEDLLIASTAVIAALGTDKDCFKTVVELDGLRLLWSLFRSKNDVLRGNAVLAVVPLLTLENSESIGRTFIGGLELLLGLLTSEDSYLLCGGCMALSKVALSEANLKVLTEDGVVPLLARIVTIAVSLEYSKNDNDHVIDPSSPDTFVSTELLTRPRAPPVEGGLRMALAKAIETVCKLPSNRLRFNQLQAVCPLIRLLTDERESVLKAVARSLAQLTKAEANSLDLLNAGAVPYLVKLMGSEDEDTQDHAAEATSYVRRHFLNLNPSS
ncbi:hypothetical protein GEMRC1_001483 [Eukaryota sp. GEM-RC1]